MTYSLASKLIQFSSSPVPLSELLLRVPYSSAFPFLFSPVLSSLLLSSPFARTSESFTPSTQPSPRPPLLSAKHKHDAVDIRGYRSPYSQIKQDLHSVPLSHWGFYCRINL